VVHDITLLTWIKEARIGTTAAIPDAVYHQSLGCWLSIARRWTGAGCVVKRCREGTSDLAVAEASITAEIMGNGVDWCVMWVSPDSTVCSTRCRY